MNYTLPSSGTYTITSSWVRAGHISPLFSLLSKLNIKSVPKGEVTTIYRRVGDTLEMKVSWPLQG